MQFTATNGHRVSHYLTTLELGHNSMFWAEACSLSFHTSERHALAGKGRSLTVASGHVAVRFVFGKLGAACHTSFDLTKHPDSAQSLSVCISGLLSDFLPADSGSASAQREMTEVVGIQLAPNLLEFAVMHHSLGSKRFRVRQTY